MTPGITQKKVIDGLLRLVEQNRLTGKTGEALRRLADLPPGDWTQFAGKPEVADPLAAPGGSALDLRSGGIPFVKAIVGATGPRATLALPASAIKITQTPDSTRVEVALKKAVLQDAEVDTVGGLASATMIGPWSKGDIEVRKTDSGWTLDMATSTPAAWTQMLPMVVLKFGDGPNRMVSLDAEGVTVDRSAFDLERLQSNVQNAKQMEQFYTGLLQAHSKTSPALPLGARRHLLKMKQRLRTNTRAIQNRRSDLRAAYGSAGDLHRQAATFLFMDSFKGLEHRYLKKYAEAALEAKKAANSVRGALALGGDAVAEGLLKEVEAEEVRTQRTLSYFLDVLEGLVKEQGLEDEHFDAIDIILLGNDDSDQTPTSYRALKRIVDSLPESIERESKRLEQAQTRAAEKHEQTRVSYAESIERSQTRIADAEAELLAFKPETITIPTNFRA